MIQERAKVDPFLQQADDQTKAVNLPKVAPGSTGSVGETLRAAREARGLSQSDISARLKFGVRQIEALEHERWDELPKGPSLRGLVRNYARLLGIDGEALLAALPAHVGSPPVSVAIPGSAGDMHPAPLPRHGGDTARRGRVWFIGFTLLVLISLLALAAYVVFTWWLPRMSGNGSEPATLNLPYAASSQDGPTIPIPVMSASSGNGSPATTDGQTQQAGGVEAPPEQVQGTEEAAVAAAGAPARTQDAAGNVAVAPPAGAPSGDAAAQHAPAGSVSSSGDVALVQADSEAGIAITTATGTATTQSVASTTAQGSAPTTAATQANQLSFNVSEDSWIEVYDRDGAPVLYTTLTRGTQRTIDVTPPARVVIGNVNGVEVQWQGVDVNLKQYRRGNVARFTVE